MFLKSKLPEFEVETKPEAFTLDSLIEWLRTQEPEKEYDWFNCYGECLFSQYAMAHAECRGGESWIMAKSQFRSVGRFTLGMTSAIACSLPRTFGAALSRAITVRNRL